MIYKNILNGSESLVIKKGYLNSKKAIRVRVISIKFNKIKSIKDNIKFKKSLRYLSKYSNFILIVLNDNKPENKNENITLRYYGIGAQIIKDMRVKNMILITRSRKKSLG